MKRVFIIIIWVVLVAGLLSVLGISYTAHQSTVCNKLDILITYQNGDIFLTANDINDFLALKKVKIKGAALSEINNSEIESSLYTIPSVEAADVYTTVDGNMKILITQRKPIVRIFNKFGQTFYIDDKGKLMPASEHYTARLLVAIGNINEMYNSSLNLDVKDTLGSDTLVMKKALYKIYRLTQFINQDDFWKAMIDEVFINNAGDLELFTKIGDQTVIFGDIDSMKEKFDKLLVFYKQGLNKTGWSKYKTINLKYKNQVVCSKI